MRNKEITRLLLNARVIKFERIKNEDLDKHPPENIYKDADGNFLMDSFTDKEIDTLIQLKQLKRLSTIKNILLIFFWASVLAVIIYARIFYTL